MVRAPSKFLLFFSVFLLFYGCRQREAPVVAEETPPSPHLSASHAEALVRECQVCHGVREAQRGPIIDGMEYWYLLEQLEKFHSGVRGQNPANRSEHLMGIGVKKIKTPVEMAYLADWFSRQEPKPSIHTVKGDRTRGKEFYDQRCASCHGAEAQGNRVMQSPSLTRLEGWYFLDQMRKFRSGDRGYHRSDLSGQVMAAASKDLTDRTLRDIVAYVVDAYGPEEDLTLHEKMVPKKSAKPF